MRMGSQTLHACSEDSASVPVPPYEQIQITALGPDIVCAAVIADCVMALNWR